MERRSPLAEHIRDLRNNLLETQHEFAARLGVAQQTLARYETNDVPKRSILKALLELSQKANYRTGALAFNRALGGKTADESIVSMSEAELLRLLASLSEMSGAWTFLKTYLPANERVKHLANLIDKGLPEVMDRLSKLPLCETGEEK